LIAGSRKDISEANGSGLLRELCTEAGYTQVSIDYRLAPETKLPGVIEDVRDAWEWIHAELPSHFDVDTDRSAVLGRSAGGFLTLLSGIILEPRPRALVSLYGYGDLLAPWCNQQDPYYGTQALVAEPEARSLVGKGVVVESSPSQPRIPFYLFCRQQGLWIQEVTGMNPSYDHDQIAAFCPVRNISANYPPTLLLHGTADTDVPYHASVEMAHALSTRGLSAELASIPDADHLFDRTVTAADLKATPPSASAAALQKILAFLQLTLGD
jgi:acetyl esterase/lipase